jgi:hypothetical protein
MADLTIRLDRGEYREQLFSVAARNADGTPGTPQSLATVQEIVWMVKKRLQDTDAQAKITRRLSVSGQIILADQGSSPGDLTVVIPTSATASLPAGDYFHQLWITDGAGQRQPAFSPPARLILVQPAHLP